MRKNPRGQNDEEQNERADHFEGKFRWRKRRWNIHVMARADQVSPEIKIKIRAAHNRAEKIFRLAQSLDAKPQTVLDRIELEKEKRGDHFTKENHE